MISDDDYIADLNRQIAQHKTSFSGTITPELLAFHRRAYPLDGHFDAISGCYQFGADFSAELRVPVIKNWKQWLAWYVAPYFIPRGHNRPLFNHANREGFMLGMGGAVSCAHANPQTIIGNCAGDPWPKVREEHKYLENEVSKQPGTRLCTTADEVRAAKAAGERSLIFGLEGAHGLGFLPKPGADNIETSRRIRLKRLVRLKTWYKAAYLTLDHYCASDASRAGMIGNRFLPWSRLTRDLTPFGERIVTTAIDLGLLVDVAHTARASLLKVCAIARSRGVPVIATHSGSRTVMEGMRAKIRRRCGLRTSNNRRTARMLDDDCIKAVVETGGCIGVIIGTQFLVNMRYRDFTGANDAPLSVFLEHYEKLANLIRNSCAGVDPWDHLSFGTDFDGSLASIPWEIRGARDLPLVTLAMLERGWPKDRIERVYSENFLRVWNAAEDAANGSAA